MFINTVKWVESMFDGVDDNLNKLNDFKPLLIDNLPFYISSYECPLCKDFLLYKMRVRNQHITFNNGVFETYNIFTCPGCRRFFASVLCNKTHSPRTLNSFALVSEEISQSDYISVLKELQKFENG